MNRANVNATVRIDGKEWSGRVRLSEEGVRTLVDRHHASKMRADIEGTVQGATRYGCIKVLWDGYATVYSYHPDYLRAVE